MCHAQYTNINLFDHLNKKALKTAQEVHNLIL